MSKFRLTAEELLLVKLIFLVQEGHQEYYRTFSSECEHNDIYDLLLSLQEKDVVLKSCKFIRGSVAASDIVFNKNFLKNYLKNSYELGMELFQAYPKLLYIDGKPYSLRNIAKNYNTFEEFSFAYGKLISFDEEKHKEVLELLEWAKERDLIHYGICEFIISMKWMELADLRDGETYNSYDVPTIL